MDQEAYPAEHKGETLQISRVLSESLPSDHLSRIHVAMNLKRPTFPQSAGSASERLVFLRVGFSYIPMSPRDWWSLTPPFHPY